MTPVLFVTLVLVIVRSVTLPGAGEGVRWLFAFEPGNLGLTVVMAALGQVVFSVGLGGTLMVGLLAGLAIFPAVFALGLEPGAGPGLLFATLPEVFARVPAGWLFGFLFFGGLAAAALLSGIAAYEVLVAGFTDSLGWSRRRATWTVYAVSLLLALPPMVNLDVFIPWDLTFGSGGQTFGALVAVVTVGWVMQRGALLEEVAAGARVGRRPTGGETAVPSQQETAVPGEASLPSGLMTAAPHETAAPSRLDLALAVWLRWVVPTAVLAAAVWWFVTHVLGAVAGV